jgi:molybdopterin converting factor small subunit
MNRVVIRIPTPLRGYTAGADEVAVDAATVAEALSRLGARHPGILERVIDDAGEPRQFVNIFVGGANVRALDGMATPLAEGAVLAIIPAVAGGTHESEGRTTARTQGAHRRA